MSDSLHAACVAMRSVLEDVLLNYGDCHCDAAKAAIKLADEAGVPSEDEDERGDEAAPAPTSTSPRDFERDQAEALAILRRRAAALQIKARDPQLPVTVPVLPERLNVFAEEKPMKRFKTTIPLDRMFGEFTVISREALERAVENATQPLYVTNNFDAIKPPLGYTTAIKADAEGLHVEGVLRDDVPVGVRGKVVCMSIGFGCGIQITASQMTGGKHCIEDGRLTEIGMCPSHDGLTTEVDWT